jgi:hypothetical protein
MAGFSFGPALSHAAHCRPPMQPSLNRTLAFDHGFVRVPMNVNIRADMAASVLVNVAASRAAYSG